MTFHALLPHFAPCFVVLRHLRVEKPVAVQRVALSLLAFGPTLFADADVQYVAVLQPAVEVTLLYWLKAVLTYNL